MKIEAEKLANWIDDNVGQSSIAIFLYMAKGEIPRAFDAPGDHGDRERCAILLQAVPEWIPRLKEIEDLHVAGMEYSNEHPSGGMVEPWNEEIPLIRELLPDDM